MPNAIRAAKRIIKALDTARKEAFPLRNLPRLAVGQGDVRSVQAAHPPSAPVCNQTAVKAKPSPVRYAQP